MATWWNPASWDWAGVPDTLAGWLWTDPFIGPVVQVGTDTAIAAAISDSPAYGGDGRPSLGDVLGSFLDPVVPNFVYTPPAGITVGGGLHVNPPGENGYGWFPQGLVPDVIENAAKQALPLVLVGLAAALALSRRD